MTGIREDFNPGCRTCIFFMSTSLRLRPALARKLGRFAPDSNRDASALADDALSQFVRSHRETVYVTSTRPNVQRIRAAYAEIEAEIVQRKRRAA